MKEITMLGVTQGYIDELIQNNEDVSKLSDGYHTFDELYEFRKVYNALLFNIWGKQLRYIDGSKVIYPVNAFDFIRKSITAKYDVHKSWKHNDGEWCFGEEKKWFIVVAMLPTGQISNHYKAEDWDLFKIPEVEKAKYPFDGHTPSDVLQRLKELWHTDL